MLLKNKQTYILLIILLLLILVEFFYFISLYLKGQELNLLEFIIILSLNLFLLFIKIYDKKNTIFFYKTKDFNKQQFYKIFILSFMSMFSFYCVIIIIVFYFFPYTGEESISIFDVKILFLPYVFGTLFINMQKEFFTIEKYNSEHYYYVNCCLLILFSLFFNYNLILYLSILVLIFLLPDNFYENLAILLNDNPNEFLIKFPFYLCIAVLLLLYGLKFLDITIIRSVIPSWLYDIIVGNSNNTESLFENHMFRRTPGRVSQTIVKPDPIKIITQDGIYVGQKVGPGIYAPGKKIQGFPKTELPHITTSSSNTTKVPTHIESLDLASKTVAGVASSEVIYTAAKAGYSAVPDITPPSPVSRDHIN